MSNKNPKIVCTPIPLLNFDIEALHMIQHNLIKTRKMTRLEAEELYPPGRDYIKNIDISALQILLHDGRTKKIKRTALYGHNFFGWTLLGMFFGVMLLTVFTIRLLRDFRNLGVI